MDQSGSGGDEGNELDYILDVGSTGLLIYCVCEEMEREESTIMLTF